MSDAPTHVGWMGFVPVWLWLDGDDSFTVHPRFHLPGWLLDLAGWMQVASCDVLGAEPAFAVKVIRPLTDRETRRWERHELREAGADRPTREGAAVEAVDEASDDEDATARMAPMGGAQADLCGAPAVPEDVLRVQHVMPLAAPWHRADVTARDCPDCRPELHPHPAADHRDRPATQPAKSSGAVRQAGPVPTIDCSVKMRRCS